MSRRLIFYFISFTIVLCSKNTLAQAPVATLENSLVSTFNEKLSPQIRLYNGVSYLGYAGKLEGNAYLDDNIDFVNGSIVYDGFVFNNVPLLYDLVEDKLVSIYSDGYSKYSFRHDKLTSFTINNRKFINVLTSKPEDVGTKKYGIYEASYEGKIKVLIKRTKSFKEVIELYGVKKVFSERTEYFIMRDGLLYKVSNQSAFIRLFEDQKEALKKYIKSNKLKFRRDPVKTLVSLASYCEQLSN